MEWIPKGTSNITINLTVPNSKKAIEFYKKAFGAEVNGIFTLPGTDKVVHSSISIGGTAIYLSDSNPETGMSSPIESGECPMAIIIYTENPDKLFEQAVAAGCVISMPLADMFWGERIGNLTDPYGYVWSISSKFEDISSEEVRKRSEKFFKENPEMFS
jgi:PhnB protein